MTRILKGNPWIICNCWLIIHAWDRKVNPKELDFSKVPLWVQLWGLPLHCKSIMIGEQIGSQIGQVLDTSLYEYPDNAKIVKVKFLHDLSSPIKVGLYIGNDEDGINLVDFRYETLPMFCFRCGLVYHNEDICSSVPSPSYTGGSGHTNPSGAWLRSRIYDRRILDKKEKVFSSNPMKSVSGAQFSPIPKGLLENMAKLNMNKQ